MAQRIDPRALRPGRVWYAIGGSIAGVFIAVGIGIFIFLGVTATSEIPKLYSVHPSNGQDVSVALEGGTGYALYVPINEPGSCVLGQGLKSEPISGRLTVTRNGREWLRVAEFTVESDGVYTYRCSTSESALGEQADEGRLGGLVGGALLGGLGLPCLGIVIGGTIALVTGQRRSSYKRRLQIGY
jgi:hypothetical protein